MPQRAKVVIEIFVVLFVSYCIYLSALFVINGEVHLTNDIGRDFLLLQELDQKKIVLIGPRTNIQGVFHGVLWTYLNYPAYLIGRGDPVVVAWFWVMIEAVYLITSYIIFSKLFGRIIALIGIVLLAIISLQMTNSLFGQLMSFYLMPAFVFTLYRYFQTKNVRYVVFHLLILGCIIQFNVGVGGLVAVLTIILIGGFIYRHSLWKHIFSLVVLPFSLVNFVIFETKHNFSMTKALVEMGGSSKFIIPVHAWVFNRIENTISLQLLPNLHQGLKIGIFAAVIFLSILELRKKEKNSLLLIIVFFYFGYILLTYFNKGIILVDHIVLLSPIALMWLLTLTKGTYKFLSAFILFVIVGVNFFTTRNQVMYAIHNQLGKSQDSWLALKEVAMTVVDEQDGKNFGYYVYSPDSFAYQQRYAMLYYFRKTNASASEYVKKPETYIIISAPPPDNRYMTHEWWVKNKANITSTPKEKRIFQSGYKIEKYFLDKNEQKIPHNPDIELGIHFR
ncbi:MAG: hypothetical protein HZC02_02215 [Candidatus Levybacteria bacterium]|nr:hypothetical protein [Candidatus Levybacteria bacterium]